MGADDTGHTHEPVFATTATPGPPSPERWAELETELSGHWPPTEETACRAAGLGLVLGEFRRQDGLRIGLEQEQPCYFDMGACCFGDGELTALEFGDGEIRLVR